MKIFIVLFIFCSLNAQSQNIIKCNCEGFVDLNYRSNVLLFDKPNGKVIEKLKHNSKGEDYLLYTIDKMKGNFFHVEMSYAIIGTKFLGWISKEEYLKTYIRAYSTPVTVFKSPTSHPFLISTTILKPGTTQSFTIIGCDDNSVQIKGKMNKSEIVKGWIKNTEQCANPYTTCN